MSLETVRGRGGADPLVSVVVPAYNAMPYLRECLDSVRAQSVGTGQLELIAVDDGSTDGTGAFLDAYAAEHPWVRVVHLAGCGGPAAPRNLGVELARGRYVFFADADDYLGPEALERMAAMAEANGSDIVYGKQVGVNGRLVAASVYRFSIPRADVYDSRVYWSLLSQRLFRRAFLIEHRLRYPLGIPVASDMPFMARALVAASVVSVVADYDCYFLTSREDADHITSTPGVGPRLPHMRDIFEDFLPTVEAGPKRDALLRRHLTVEQSTFVHHLRRETDREARELYVKEFGGYIAPYLDAGLLASLPAFERVKLRLIADGDLDALLDVAATKGEPGRIVVEGDRAFAAYATFRTTPGLSDADHEVTRELRIRYELTRAEWTGAGYALAGHVRVDGFALTGAELILRRRDGADEKRLPLVLAETGAPVLEDATGEARRWAITLEDLSGLGEGLWDVHIEAAAGLLRRGARVGSLRTSDVGTAETVALAGGRLIGTYYTHPYGNLSFDSGLTRAAARAVLAMDARMRDGALTVTGRLPERAGSAPVLRLSGPGGAVEVAGTAGDGRFGVTVTAAVLRGLAVGVWRASLAWGTAGVPVTPVAKPLPRHGFREVAVDARGALVIRVGAGAWVRRALKRSGLVRRVIGRLR
ncbi:glycosyl transferase [Actinorhabdospora filicis]|uniref:Glycosyl transferase n=1 Tax=Actinorhabdospora filicis TaxID=1785913 RepID=A0A9W6SLE6_9ACTN|nr:glycosyltransferase family A protein [Actinorhabdospora filicis]GLZ77874.1 glycosyl transferase [Actinorhabdospora filicis]